MPESPRWLLRHYRYDQLRKAMAILGAGTVTDEEIAGAAATIDQTERDHRTERRRAWTPGARWIDKFGRRKLAVGGFAGMVVSALGLAGLSGTPRLVVTMVGLDLFIASFAIGVGVLVCFAALAALAIAFVYRFVPETKGLPVEEIVRLFEYRQTNRDLAGV
jgi:MFS family permease